MLQGLIHVLETFNHNFVTAVERATNVPIGMTVSKDKHDYSEEIEDIEHDNSEEEIADIGRDDNMQHVEIKECMLEIE